MPYRPLIAILTLSCTLAAANTTWAKEPERFGTPASLWVYVGTYTWKTSKGIYLCHLDMATGKLELAGVAAETVNPSFLVRHPTRPLLYAIGEVNRLAGKPGGAVSAFAIQPKTGKLTLLNQQSSCGAGPCHIGIDRTGRCVFVANYTGGNVACLPIDEQGRLGPAASVFQHQGVGPNHGRQEAPHAHGMFVDPANRIVMGIDLGADKIFFYRLDPARALLTPSDPAFFATAPGAGPRHLTFDRKGNYVYAINELASTITAMRYDAEHATLAAIQTVSTLPEGFHGSNTTAEVQIHPLGKFLYGSNRGHDSIAIFSVEAATGKLRPIGHVSTQGRSPRHFAIDPTGRYLVAANQDTNNVVVYRIDADSGRLEPTGPTLAIPAPVCIEMMRPVEH